MQTATPPATHSSEPRSVPPGERGLRLAGEPTWTIVIASLEPRDVLEAVLAEVVPACREQKVELVVVRATSAEEFRALRAEHGYPLWMPAPDGAPVAQLRAFGMAAADGDIVVLTEDSRRPSAAWVRAVTGHAARVADNP